MGEELFIHIYFALTVDRWGAKLFWQRADVPSFAEQMLGYLPAKDP